MFFFQVINSILQKFEYLILSITMIPKGLNYQPNFISDSESQQLIKFIDNQKWNYSLSRRTQHYGYEYNYNNRNLTAATPIPKEFEFLITRTGVLFNQVIINEYVANQGIAKHIDDKGKFKEIIVSISLLNPTQMTFYENSEISFNQILEPNSILTLTSDARYKWAHEIKKQMKFQLNDKTIFCKNKSYRRVSITFRIVAQ